LKIIAAIVLAFIALAGCQEKEKIEPAKPIEETVQEEIVQNNDIEVIPDTVEVKDTVKKEIEEELQKKYDIVEDMKKTMGYDMDSVPTPEYISEAWEGVKCKAYYYMQSYNESAFECTFPNAKLQQVYPIIRSFSELVLEPVLPATNSDFEYTLEGRHGVETIKTEYKYISEKQLKISARNACLYIEIIEDDNSTFADLWSHNCD